MSIRTEIGISQAAIYVKYIFDVIYNICFKSHEPQFIYDYNIFFSIKIKYSQYRNLCIIQNNVSIYFEVYHDYLLNTYYKEFENKFSLQTGDLVF